MIRVVLGWASGIEFWPFPEGRQAGRRVAMESETASSADEQQGAGSASDTRGKHRILAELKRVEQESKFLEVSFSSCFLVFFCSSV